ncbi:MAG: hypothetical protein ACM3ZC_09620 [Bacteroidota bacterium]
MRIVRLAACVLLASFFSFTPAYMGSTTPGPGSEVPFLANADFESGDKSGWTGYGGRIELVTDDVHGGKYACRAWLDQDWGGGLFTTFRAPKGKYRVSMWVKMSPGTSLCWVGADKFGGSKVSVPVRTSAAWIEVVFEVRLKDNSCELSAWAPKTPGGWILVDDVSIVPAS